MCEDCAKLKEEIVELNKKLNLELEIKKDHQNFVVKLKGLIRAMQHH